MSVWKFANIEWDLEIQPRILGILNVTPDSFSDGGLFVEPQRALEHALRMEAQGADAIDVGAESTRPGACEITIAVEWQRLESVLKLLSASLKIPISLDTRKSEIARRGIATGVQIINDVSGGRFDAKMFDVVRQTKAGYILMHSRGTPDHMMEHCHYQNLFEEIKQELKNQVGLAQKQGVRPKQIVLDPGFGFAKNVEQNDDLLDNLEKVILESYPCAIGISRKRFLREKAGGEQEKLMKLGIAGCQKAYKKGVRLFRVHEVELTVKRLKGMDPGSSPG
ncbi:MAG: dihydropteroate synthase [Deltaproteobacteria bacterium]|nr:dihydropteroate synthase [Deltaproteobacteria bacterium]